MSKEEGPEEERKTKKTKPKSSFAAKLRSTVSGPAPAIPVTEKTVSKSDLSLEAKWNILRTALGEYIEEDKKRNSAMLIQEQRDRLEMKLKNKRSHIAVLSTDNDPNIKEVAAKLYFLIEEYERTKDISMMEKYKEATKEKLEVMRKEVTLPKDYAKKVEIHQYVENFIAVPNFNDFKSLREAVGDSKYLISFANEQLVSAGFHPKFLKAMIQLYQDPEGKYNVAKMLSKLTPKEKDAILEKLASLKSNADENMLSLIHKVEKCLPTDAQAKKNQEKQDNIRQKLSGVEHFTEQSRLYLLDVTDQEFKAAERYFIDNKNEVKLKKGATVKLDDGTEVKINYSFIRPQVKGAGVIYAMADGDFLGEGAYGRVKIIQDKEGRNCAVKILGKNKAQELGSKDPDETAEKIISRETGYLKAELERQVESQRFKGVDIDTKVYEILQLRQGKEIFQHLYTNVLKPGQLYTKEEQEQKRRNQDKLSTTQELILAYKSCQATLDLHNRNIVHGDLKPANLMGNVHGNIVLVLPIDFGASKKLKPGESEIVSPDGIPKGTAERYMPKEVLQGKEPGKEAVFSKQSDIYSLGIMFRDDLTAIPKDVYIRMLRDNKNERVPLPEVMLDLINELKKIPKDERDEQVNQVIDDFEKGVRRIKEHQGPQIKPTLVAQMMSGYRDTREVVGTSKSTMYTIDDYRILATAGLLKIGATLSKEQKEAKVERNKGELAKGTEFFYNQLWEGYDELGLDVEDKITYLHNANLFLQELVKADVKVEINHQEKIAQFFDKIMSDIKKFEPSKGALLEAKFGEMQQSLVLLTEEVELQNKARQAQSKQSAEALQDMGPINLEKYISSLAKFKITGAGYDYQKYARDFAQDLLQRELNFLNKIKPSSLNESKFSEVTNAIKKHSEDLESMMIEQIVFANDKAHRARIIEFYVRVAKECIENGNYNSANSIITKLAGTAMERLNEAGELVLPAHVNKMLEEMKKVVSPERNYKAYRDNLDDRNLNKQVVIPIFTVFNSDFFKSLTDENYQHPSTKEGGPGKDNEDTMEVLGRVVQANILQPQAALSEIAVQPLKTNALQAISGPHLNDNDIVDAARSLKAAALAKKEKDKEKAGKEQVKYTQAKEKYTNRAINPPVAPPQKKLSSSEPDANQKYFAECFDKFYQHANGLDDTARIQAIFDKLIESKDPRFLVDSTYVKDGKLVGVPKIGDLYAIGTPYNPPGKAAIPREQIVIQAYERYFDDKSKSDEAREIGDCIKIINEIRVAYDRIQQILSDKDLKKGYVLLSQTCFVPFEDVMGRLKNLELMKNEPYSSMLKELIKIEEGLYTQVGPDFKQHFENWKKEDQKVKEEYERKASEKAAAKIAAQDPSAIATTAKEVVQPPPPPPPAPTEQAAGQPKAPPTKEQRQLALEKAKNIEGRKAISKTRKRAEAVGQKEKPQLPSDAEKFDKARAIVFLQGFTNQHQALLTSTENDSKSDIAKLEKKLIGFSVHPDKTIRESALKLINELGILGKPEKSYVKQLLSGFKDPTTFDSKSPQLPGELFSEDDLVKRAASLLEIVTPALIMSDLYEFYNEQGRSENREVILKNATVILNKVILADSRQEYFPNFATQDTHAEVIRFNGFIDTALQRVPLNDSEKKLLENLRDKIKNASEDVSVNNSKRTEKTTALSNKVPDVTDIRTYIETDLANENISQEVLQANAVKIENDLRNLFVGLIINMKPSEFYNLAFSKPENKVMSNAVHAFAVNFDRVTSTGIRDILQAKSIAHQINVAMLYAKALEKALESGNFPAVYSINSVFTNSAINRLTYIKEHPEIKNILEYALKVTDPDKAYKAYREEEEKCKREGKAVVPYMGIMQSDLTFTTEGNKKKKQDPINTERGEVFSDNTVVLKGVLHSKIEQLKKEVQDQAVNPIKTNFSHHLVETKLDDTVSYEKSKTLFSKISIDKTKPLNEIISSFPAAKLPLTLEITINDKNYTGKEAVSQLLEVVLPLYANVTLADKIPGSNVNVFLRSLVDSAKEHGLYQGKVKDQCDAVVKNIEPVGHEINTLMALSSYDDAFQLDYFSAANTVRTTMRERFNTFKSNVTEPSMVAHLKNITSDLDNVDKFSTLQSNFMSLKTGYDDVELETAPIEQIYKSVLDLTAAENEANSKLKSSNPAVKKAAQAYLETIREEFASDFINNITEKAISRLDQVVKDYQSLLIERAQLKAKAQQNEAVLKDISTNLESLYKGCHALSSKSEVAKNALKTIDSFVAIDKLMKDTSKGLDEKAKNIYPYLIHENPQISAFAEKMCSFEILEKISEIREQEQAFLNTFADEFDKLVAQYLEIQDKPFDDASLNGKEESINKLILKLEELSNSKFDDVKDKAQQIKAFHKPVLDAFNEIQKHKVIMNQNKEKASEKSQEESKIARLKRSLSSYKTEELSVISEDEKKYKQLFGNIQLVHQQPKIYQLQSLEGRLSEASTSIEREKILTDILNLLDKIPSASSEKDKLLGKIINEYFLDNMPKDDIAQKINYLNNKVAELEAKMKDETNPQYIKFCAKAITQFNREIKDLTYLRGTKKWRVGKGLPDKLITPDFQASIVLAVNSFNKDKEKAIAISANDISIIVKHLQQIANNPNSLAKDEAQASIEKIKEMLSNPENFEVLKECIVKKHMNIGLDYKKENVMRVIKDLGFEKLPTDSDAEISRKESGARVYQELLATEDSYLSAISKNNPDAIMEKLQEFKSQFNKYGFSEREIRSLVQSLNALYKEQRNIREEFDSASPDKWALAIKKSADHYIEYTVLYEKILRKMKDGDEKKIEGLFNKIGINFADFITGVQRPPRYVMLLKELGKYAQGEVKTQVNRALMSCKEMGSQINKRVYESEIDDLANKFDKNPTEERFAEILSLLSNGAAAKTEAGQFNYSDEQLKSFVNRLDFSKCSRKYLKLIQELKNKDNTAYKATDEKLLPLLIHKISNDRVIAELKRHMTEVSFVQKLTPFQRGLFAHIFVAIDEQAKHQGKIDIQKAVTSVKAKHQSDATATVTSENALKPFNDLFNDLIDVQHKYRPWKIKDLENATVNAVLQGLAELRGDKKAFGYNFPNYTKNDVVQYLVTKINAEPMLPLAQAHEALGHLSQVFGLEHNSKERNEILKAYSQRINELISEPYTLTQSQKTNLVTFFSQIEYLYKLRTLTPAQLKKTPALLELHNLFKNYNKVAMVLQVGSVKIELGTEFKKDVEQRKAIYEGKPVLSAQAQAELLVKNEIEMIKRVIIGSRSEPSTFNKIRGLLNRSFKEINSPAIDTVYANFIRNISNMRNMLVNYKVSPNEDIRRLAEEELQKVDAEIQRAMLDHPNVRMSQLLREILPPVQPHQVLAQPTEHSGEMPAMEALLSVSQPLPQSTITSPSDTAKEKAKAHREGSQERRRALTVGHSPSGRVEELLVQDISSLNSIIHFFEKEVENAGNDKEIVKDQDKLNAYGIHEIVPSKIKGNEDHITIKMRKADPTKAQDVPDKPSADETVDVIVGPGKKGGMEYNSRGPLPSAAIMNLCKLVVDSAEPGDKFKLPTVDSAQNREMKEALLRAIKARCEREKIPFKEGSLEIPENAKSPSLKQKTPKFGGVG